MKQLVADDLVLDACQDSHSLVYELLLHAHLLHGRDEALRNGREVILGEVQAVMGIVQAAAGVLCGTSEGQHHEHQLLGTELWEVDVLEEAIHALIQHDANVEHVNCLPHGLPASQLFVDGQLWGRCQAEDALVALRCSSAATKGTRHD